MGLDLGEEYFKVAIVKPGVPMEIALNKESKRKTPTVVTIKSDEILTGTDGLAKSIQFPKHSFRYALGLLGKTIDSPAVAEFKRLFAGMMDVEEDSETGTVVFRHPELEKPVSVEQVIALVLKNAATTAANYAEVAKVKDTVITVPVFMNQHERERLVFVAQELAGLKVLQLINSNAAIALNFGMFRRKEFADSTKYFVIYNSGSTQTTASVVEIKMDEKTKDPTASILGVSWDRTLGGIQYDMRIRDWLKAEFEKKHPKFAPVNSPRALAKLLKEAQKVRQVLSANNAIQARIENLTGDDVDLRVDITREIFEEICADLFERALEPLNKAVIMSGITKEEGNEVLLFGGLTRTPLIKQKIIDLGYTLLANINTDEAAAIGASYRAADLSSAFRVKPFAVKNASPVQIQVEFDREIEDEETGEKRIKHSKRVLFAPGNSYPQKKVLTFNKYEEDFKFEVNYGDVEEYIHLNGDAAYYQERHLMTVDVTGVKAALEKHEKSTPKGIKVHFSLDDGGFFGLSRIEHLFEKEVEVVKKDEKTAKKGKVIKPVGDKGDAAKAFKDFNTINMDDFKDMDWSNPDPEMMKKFQAKMDLNKDFDPSKFGFGDKAKKDGEEGEEVADEENSEENSEESAEETAEEADADKAEETEEKTEAEEKTEEKSDEQSEDSDNSEKKFKTVTFKSNLEGNSAYHGMKLPSKEIAEGQLEFIKDMEKKELEKEEKEASLNAIESFIYDKKDKLTEEGGYSETATEEEKEVIRAALTEAEDWLWDVEEPTSAVYNEKLAELEKISDKWLSRAKEFRDRPQIIKSFKDQFNATKHIIKDLRVKNAKLPEDDKMLTESEIDSLVKKYENTMEWQSEILAKQKAMKHTEEPVMTYEKCYKRSEELRREVDYVLRKAKSYRPKPKKKEEKKDEKTEEKSEKSEEKPDEEKTTEAPKEEEVTHDSAEL